MHPFAATVPSRGSAYGDGRSCSSAPIHRRNYRCIRSLAFGGTPLLSASVNIFRCLLLAAFALSIAACASSRKSKPQARIYESDTNPGITMHDEAQAPGSPVGQ